MRISFCLNWYKVVFFKPFETNINAFPRYWNMFSTRFFFLPPVILVTDSSLTLVKTGRHPLEESLPNYWSWAAPVLEVTLFQSSPHLCSSCLLHPSDLLPPTQHREFPSDGRAHTPQTPHSSCGLCAAVRRGWAASLEVMSWSPQDWGAGRSGAQRGCCGEQGSTQSWRKGYWGHWHHSNNESR